MNRAKRLYILLGVLVAACLAAFLALHIEQRQEQIQISGETVLSIETSSVDSLSWSYEGETLAFHRDGDWLYDEDDAFPVDAEKIEALLEPFAALNAAFTITDVEDYGQYGLDDPVCTIDLTAGGQSYQILLGDFSTMDEQRYLSIGDGNVYLAVEDPLDGYDVELSDLIANDEIPDFDRATELTFAGAQNYRIVYQEDSADTYCADDVYFIPQDDGSSLPLDISRVEDYLDDLTGLSLRTYVTYDVTEDQLSTYGLDDPDLTVTVSYATDVQDENGEESEITGSFVLQVSRVPVAQEEDETATETAEATAEAFTEASTEEAEPEGDAEAAEEEEAEVETVAYARVGDSAIIYEIPDSDYEALLAAAYDDLRHAEVFTGDFDDITRLDIALDGASYAITTSPDEDAAEATEATQTAEATQTTEAAETAETTETGDEARTYWYQGEELTDVTALQEALESLEAESFTTEAPSGQEEISLTLHLDNENFPQVVIQIYRLDGASCLAVVDGEPVSLIPRTQAVDLMEAVRAIVLN